MWTADIIRKWFIVYLDVANIKVWHNKRLRQLSWPEVQNFVGIRLRRIESGRLNELKIYKGGTSNNIKMDAVKLFRYSTGQMWSSWSPSIFQM